MSYLAASFLLGILAEVGLVVAVAGMWRFWKMRPSRRLPEIAPEAERWLQGQQGGSGSPDWQDP